MIVNVSLFCYHNFKKGSWLTIVLSTLTVIIKNQCVCVTIRICLHHSIWGNGCLELSGMKSCVKAIGNVAAQIECDLFILFNYSISCFFFFCFLFEFSKSYSWSVQDTNIIKSKINSWIISRYVGLATILFYKFSLVQFIFVLGIRVLSTIYARYQQLRFCFV